MKRSLKLALVLSLGLGTGCAARQHRIGYVYTTDMQGHSTSSVVVLPRAETAPAPAAEEPDDAEETAPAPATCRFVVTDAQGSAHMVLGPCGG